MHFSTMCSSCPRNHLQTDIPKEEIYFQLMCHSRAKDIYVKQYMAKEERKKIRLVFCQCDNCQFQDLSFEQSYIKLKVFVFFQRSWKKSCVLSHPFENGSATVGETKGRPSLLILTFTKIQISSWICSR